MIAISLIFRSLEGVCIGESGSNPSNREAGG